jgi:hypothetical protein
MQPTCHRYVAQAPNAGNVVRSCAYPVSHGYKARGFVRTSAFWYHVACQPRQPGNLPAPDQQQGRWARGHHNAVRIVRNARTMQQMRVSFRGSGVGGADKRTRTFTGVTPQRPQRCASTNSAISAHLGLGAAAFSGTACGRKGGMLHGASPDGAGIRLAASA